MSKIDLNALIDPLESPTPQLVELVKSVHEARATLLSINEIDDTGTGGYIEEQVGNALTSLNERFDFGDQ